MPNYYQDMYTPEPLGELPVYLNSKRYSLMGGPYLAKPSMYHGIKMAIEIDAECDVDVPTVDFSTPSVDDLRLGLIRGIGILTSGQKLYVGCLGGIGRTGLYMAALAKVMVESGSIDYQPVEYVRTFYDDRAVETNKQKEFIKAIDVTDIAKWVKVL